MASNYSFPSGNSCLTASALASANYLGSMASSSVNHAEMHRTTFSAAKTQVVHHNGVILLSIVHISLRGSEATHVVSSPFPLEGGGCEPGAGLWIVKGR